MTTSTRSPLDAVAELRAQRKSARRAATDAGADIARLQRAHRQAREAVTSAHEQAARGHRAALKTARDAEAKVEAELAEARARNEGAQRAVHRVEDELTHLYRDEFDAFAEVAAAKSKKAAEALQALAGPVEETGEIRHYRNIKTGLTWEARVGSALYKKMRAEREGGQPVYEPIAAPATWKLNET